MDGINEIKKLIEITLFKEVIEKLTIGEILDYEELSFILSVSIVFLQEYQEDKRKTNYLTFAYFIVLKVALINKLYQPLFDVSINLGFFPISRFIVQKNLIDTLTLDSITKDVEIEAFKYENHIEMYQQNKNRKEILSSDKLDNVYIAPTSFGKSSLVIDIIKKNLNKKIALIVPSKSLLAQNFLDLKNKFPNHKILFNEDMYNGELNFICVFTQERTLRLFSKSDEIYFDIMIIDEAHNLLDNDQRSVILSRVIRRNRFRNSGSKHYYLSPLINDSNNLKLDEGQEFFERKIKINIKEPDYFEFKENGDFFKFNRFLDLNYKIGKVNDLYEYINVNSKIKNFIYLKTPKKVEEFSQRFSRKLKNIESLEILSKVLSDNIHEDFYCVDYIKKGLIYLHGGLPDFIKEFLEYKFKNDFNIKYLVANSVVLEGINFPIESLFILNTTDLKIKSLINLIGRVNRLNEVFDIKNKDLEKLNPNIHFVNDTYFNGKGRDMYNKMKLLRSSVFEDNVENPVLLKSVNNKLKQESLGSDSVPENLDDINNIREWEDFLIYNNDKENYLLKILMEQDIHNYYSNFNEVYEVLKNRVGRYKGLKTWMDLTIVDKIYYFFFADFDFYLKKRYGHFLRFNHESVRNFYTKFIRRVHKLSLKSHIKFYLDYFDWLAKNKPKRYSKFYFGISFGEIPYSNESKSNTCVNLSQKNKKQLVNLAMVKLKIETDFVNFYLSKFVNVLYELELIDESEYNIFMYGSESRENIELFKVGLSTQLINFLKDKKQLHNLKIQNGKLQPNSDFTLFMNDLDEIKRFEISRLI
ncbi:DNA helicase [Acinetobacter nosocomialis]|uniref:DEAD/DEAH box helicase n=1 Tax=Acinetobacter nosocomialis TaxID=106654 RepID=UPI000D0BD780|nr:DEAD/DEAH box helicase [Acinetobacter nosocomialis]PSE45608.1 DNA helicase [Acinetobacter nosocomialis]PSE82607.1 DNA helicase [Acinetobacter nosocomialis]